MKFFVDANLPPSLCAWLQLQGHTAIAASDAGLRDSEDGDIWEWAMTNSAAIISKDEDFAERRSRSSAGPQVVWIRIGNTTNEVLFARLSNIWGDVVRELANGAALIEVR